MRTITRLVLASSLLFVSASALASGAFYINGVRVDPRSVAGATFDGVSISVDANGDIYVDAPRHRVEVQGATDAAALDPVTPETYWLVVQDDASTGHEIDIVINNRIVKTVSSGGRQVVMDLAPFLQRGENAIRIVAKPGAVPGGGDLNILIGEGSNDSGTLVLGRLDINYSRGASDPPTGGSRSFTLNVP